MTSVSLRSSSRGSNACRPTSRSGFSILEVIITLAIVSLLTTLVMVRYSSFNSSTLLRNQAYEIALDLREAQVFATSIRSDQNQFREEYGLHFDASSGQTQEYTFWRDAGTDDPPVFDNGSDDELSVMTLDSRFAIVDVCVNNATRPCTTNTVDVSFRRPNFDAIIVPDGGPLLVDSVSLYVAPQANASATRAVTITQTGQITVQ